MAAKDLYRYGELEQIARSQFLLLDTLQKQPRERQVDAVAILFAIVAHAKRMDIREVLYRAEKVVDEGRRGNLPHIGAAIQYAEEDI